jgi:tetratricopeptide (TPR) repeat protein
MWLFRILVAVVIPVAVVLAVEAILVLCKVGRPMGFAYPAVVEGNKVALSNPYFTWQFFEPQMARSIQPFALPMPKPAGNCRVFVLGSSAAQGDPEPMFGLPRILQTLLADQYPGVNFEVVNAATVAINSHVTLRIAGACADLEPDLFVVYMGNNEVTGPFGAGTVFSPLRSSRTLITAHLAAKRSRIGQALEALKKSLVDRGRAPVPWLGMEMFLDQSVPLDDPRLQTTYRNFRANLADIFDIADAKKIPVVVSTVAVNLKDCAPFASRHRPQFTDDQQHKVDALCKQAEEFEDNSKTAEAIEALGKAIEIDDSFADLHDRIARLYLRQKDIDNAAFHFRRACDLDTLRFRADTNINRFIAETAQSGLRKNVRFVDAAAILENQCADRLAGLDFFYDHVHLNFSGNFVVAEAMAERMRDILPDWVRNKASGRPLLPQSECQKRLCYTGLDRLTIAQMMSNRLLRPPFTSQRDHQRQVEFFQAIEKDGARFRSGTDLAQCLAQYESVIGAVGPGDWLHFQYAKWLRIYGNDTHRARQHLQLLLDRYPQWIDGYNQMSKLAFVEGDPAQAESLCWKVIALNPYIADAWLGLGVIRQQQNRLDEAVGFMHKSIAFDPYSVDNHLALGIAFMAKSSFADATRQIERAVELDPTNARVWFYRGYCLMAEKADPPTRQKAIEYMQKAVELSPDYAEARGRLALLFIQDGRPADAVPHLEEVVKVRPQDPQTLYLLAQCILKTNPSDPDGLKKARSLLERAVALRDDFEQAQYDLAAVLANMGQTELAKQRFGKVLQINPQNQKAKQLLAELK